MVTITGRSTGSWHPLRRGKRQHTRASSKALTIRRTFVMRCERVLLAGFGLLLVSAFSDARGAEAPPAKAAKGEVQVGEIIVFGNTATRQGIILRQLPFRPGQAIKLRKLRVAE